MKYFNLFIVCLFISVNLFGQVSDDFTDDDFTNSPVWSGDVGSFEVLNPPTSSDGAIDAGANADTHVLRSKQSSGDAILTTPSNTAYGEWIFSVADGRNWSVSGNNDYKIILISDKNIVGDLTDGSHNFNGYFFQFDGGNEDNYILYKQTGNTTNQILDTGFPGIDDTATPEGKTVKITRSATGEWTVFIDVGFEISPTTQRGASATDNTHTSSSFFGIATNISSAGTERVLYFDNLSITPLPTNDTDSEITAGANVKPSGISSIENSADGLQIFDVNLTDKATADGLPTIIDNIKFTQGTGNEIADWTTTIAGAKLFGDDIPGGLVGTVNSSDITFSGNDFISITDGTTETYHIKIWLKTDLTSISDNDNIAVKLAFSDITADATGSSFGTGTIQSGQIPIEIDATKLVFNQVPTDISTAGVFSVTVAGTDVNGNIDTDFTSAVTLAKQSGTGILSSVSGLSANAVGGSASWTDLKYDTEETFTISASSGAFTPIASGNIIGSNLMVYVDDDFDDGNLDDWGNIADWASSTDSPITGTHSLKHNLSGIGGTSYISTSISGLPVNDGTTTWRFNLKNGAWDPSGTNSFGFYLFADTPDLLSSSINGYIVGVDVSGSDDLLTIWKVEDGSFTSVIASAFNWNSAETIGVEVLRSNSGNWTLKYDTDGNFDNLTTAGNSTDNTFTNALYCGLIFKYSSTRAGELWFDDLYISGPPDTTKPQLLSAFAPSENTLNLTFSEITESTTGENIANYSVNNGLGNPQTAVINVSNPSQITLTFSGTFASETKNTLSVTNIKDNNGNIISDVDFDFTYIKIKPEKVTLLSDSSIDVYFNKEVDITTAQTLMNYDINSGIGNPKSAIIDGSNPALIHLIFDNKFISETNYTLNIDNIQDTYGNVANSENFNVNYYEAKAYDIIINEIMCDVSPQPEALPAVEYLEIRNNSTYDINLKDWTITFGTNSPKNFPDSVIQAGTYAIICNEADVSDMAVFGLAIPVSVSSQLTTTGKRIVIRNNKNIVIEDIEYSQSWYNDDDKKSGGYSIERIDYENFCGEEENWHASGDFTGGTPGRENSIYAVNPDNKKPVADELVYISSKHLQVVFSEKVDATSVSQSNFLLSGSTQPSSFSISDNYPNLIELYFTNNFSVGTNNLSVKNIKDKCGNTMEEQILSFSYKKIEIEEILVVSDFQLRLIFSEKPETISAETSTNYSVNNSLGNPSLVTTFASDSTFVDLTFTGKFTLGQTYIITISGISDVNTNQISTTQTDFVYYIPKENDLIFTEIMCDVNPEPVGVPAYEYIEIYNRSDYAFKLSGWKFQAEGQSEREFSDSTILPGKYILLSELSAVEDLSDYSPAYGILKSTDISVSGKKFKIISPEGLLINEVDYSNTWYQDDTKNNGGYSLEKIDKENFCGAETNWKASEDYKGGTPGSDNSVNASNPDSSSPEITKIFYINSKTLRIIFSEKINTTVAQTITNYTLNTNTNPVSATQISDNKTTIDLIFINDFLVGNNTIKFDNIQDNCNNIMNSETKTFNYELIKIKTIKVLSSTQLQLIFTEKVNKTDAKKLVNYSVNNNLGSPTVALVSATDSTIVNLVFETNFTDGKTLTLTTENIKDSNGNTMTKSTTNFIYYIPKKFDIVFTEIMCDVQPSPVSLPAVNYIEIRNNSSLDIDLTGWIFVSKGQAEREFPEYILKSGEYLLLSQDNDTLALKDYGKVLGILTWSDLTVSGKQLRLISPQNEIIAQVEYENTWYGSEEKQNGGFSLEVIDYFNNCSDDENWTASNDYKGGTPGAENSVNANNPDISKPEILSVTRIYSNRSDIIFTENIDKTSAENTENYKLNDTDSPSSIDFSSEIPDKVILHFTNNFPEGKNTITIKNISDNCSNIMENYNSEFENTLIYPVSLKITSNKQVHIKFSEEVDKETAENIENYFVNNSIGKPEYALISSTDSSSVYLQFKNPFTEEVYNTLTISNIKDATGNIMKNTDMEFIFYIPKQSDIVFTEIMCDISPAPLGLPEAKYIEIYNTSDFDISLEGWKFQSEGQSERNFPDSIINSGEYIIMCQDEYQNEFAGYGKIVTILSSSDLVLSDRNLKLTSPEGKNIANITYLSDWYNDEEKSSGGYSLEIIDPMNFCGGAYNWHASENANGGTPGKLNSVFASNLDTSLPELNELKVINSKILYLYFSESLSETLTVDNFNISGTKPDTLYFLDNDFNKLSIRFSDNFPNGEKQTLLLQKISDKCNNISLDFTEEFTYNLLKPNNLTIINKNMIMIKFSEQILQTTAENINNYSVDNSIGMPLQAKVSTTDSSTVLLTFTQDFPLAKELEISISSLSDINLNIMEPTKMKFTYYIAQNSDIVINEILFNPTSGGTDFVEIYNRSDYEIDLKTLYIAKRNDDGYTESSKPFSEESLIISPASYYCFTENKEITTTDYLSENEDAIIEIKDLPSYSDDEGTVVILLNDSIVIDEFSYTDDMHFALLDEDDGVSLERINYNNPTQDENNWHSAASDVGFATPGYENSQFNKNPNASNENITIEPEIFSPDNDGIDDFASIFYNFDNSGNVANVIIYDSKGRQIRRLANNKLLGTSGVINWDGLYENNQKAQSGIYIVYFEVFDLSGNVNIFKKPVVLATRF